MVDAIPQTNVTHLYAMVDDGLWAQHLDIKWTMREHIRANRSKDTRHVTEHDVVPRVVIIMQHSLQQTTTTTTSSSL
ncbi:hypothetical protein NFJ02_14g15780 [Pycnococcus provasolii]